MAHDLAVVASARADSTGYAPTWCRFHFSYGGVKMRLHVQGIALILTITAAITPGRSLEAQTERQDPHVRNDCRLAAQVLETDHPAPHYEWALEFIAKCEETGAPVLAALWRRAVDTERLDRLSMSSYLLRDARITDAVTEVAQNRALPRLVRLNAIRVLAGHAVPEYNLSIRDLLRRENEFSTYLFPVVDHIRVRNGERPVDHATIRGIVEALGPIRNDPDADVAVAAARTRRHICWRLGWQECNHRR
jgi:hypothetical protein